MNKPIVRKRERTVRSTVPSVDELLVGSICACTSNIAALAISSRRGVALRAHGKANLTAIEASIKEHGFLVPILVDNAGRIIAGHGRWLAATNLGLPSVPVICVSHLTEEQIRLFTLADNKVAEKSKWDPDELRLELAELAELNLTLDLNIELSGFTTTEIDNILAFSMEDSKEKGEGDDEHAPEVQKIAICKAGDVWTMGAHKLVCGSSLEASTFELLLGDERSQMVFSDAPYNVPASMISGLGKHKHSDFQMASGEMAPPEFTQFLFTAFENCAAFSIDGSIHYQCMDWRHMREMLDAGYRAYTELKNLVIYKKHSAGMGTFYRSQHELIFVWKSGTAPHINNFGLGDTGRYRSNVWEYKGNCGFHKERDAELAAHATVKPWGMVADAIRDCSKRGGIILDPFGGSGTTLIAAERTGRKARLVELDPLYCDVTIRRWQALTGKDAIHAESGQTFAELEAGVLELADGGQDGLGDDAACDEEAE